MEQEKYRYYSTQRPIGPGTCPKGPVEAVHYESRSPVAGETFSAWSVLTYDRPLTDREQFDYALRPSRDNPDIRGKLEQHTQFVGEWETRNHIPSVERLTRLHPDSGRYVLLEDVSLQQLAERRRMAYRRPLLSERSGGKKSGPRRGGR